MFVQVATDLSLGKLFDYTVPEALREKLAVGQLLSVRFGHRQTHGFAMRICDGEPPAGLKTRPIDAIADEKPFFTPALLELIDAVARYTASPVESVLRAAVPAVVSRGETRAKTVFFIEAVEGADVSILTERQKWLYSQIVRLHGGRMAQVAAELRAAPSTLRKLESLGAVRIEPQSVRRVPLSARNVLPTKPLPLNPAQSAALAEIVAAIDSPSGRKPVLLRGVTGSGKTEVYMQAIAHVLGRGGGAVVMVPEIALTPQTVRRFASRFGDTVAVLHSALSDGERRDEWHRIRSGEAKVVIGPRSVVFAPVAKLALVVVDEEHETSYKQEDLPRYNARDAAVLRGKIENAAVVLGSATPSLESWFNALSGKYSLVTLPVRAGKGRMPDVTIVDMEEEGSRGRIFSPALVDAVRSRLVSGEQTILFLNRRGFARSASCPKCGWTAVCGECSLPYTYHRYDECLRCHVCGRWELPPPKCPACGKSPLDYTGIGTQRAEAALSAIFPDARILRMDADTTSRRHSHDDILGSFRRGEADILLGTQMIAKGLDFPNVTLVGVLNADSSMNMPDFRAAERTFQLVSQVAGRAGRAELPGEVFVQTYIPDSGVLKAAARGDYEGFAKAELDVRKALSFPPYCHLSLVSVKSRSQSSAERWARFYSSAMKKAGDLVPGEAVPSAVEKADGWFRWQVVVKSARISRLVGVWKWLLEKHAPPAGVKASLDVDAFDFW
ncbi:MAG: primosomal protein N' [Kiritimatiellae bacterium]|nr:primosomal protein N' [Kiritimatiellia bacterium]